MGGGGSRGQRVAQLVGTGRAAGAGGGGPWSNGLFRSQSFQSAPWRLRAEHWGQRDEEDKASTLWELGGQGGGKEHIPR